MNKILLVEDDKKLSALITEYLTKQGYQIEYETRGDKAVYRILHETYFLVILDLNLPVLSGLQVCKLVRRNFNGFILILTAREADEDQITGFEFGADDYVNKPLHPRILLARIKALTRREKARITINSKLEFGQLKIDLESRMVNLKNKNVNLTPAEYNLLVLLASNAGTSLTRDTIMRALRGIDYDGIDRTIDLRIAHLRKKLKDNINMPYKIKTVRNQGYVFLPNAWD